MVRNICSIIFKFYPEKWNKLSFQGYKLSKYFLGDINLQTINKKDD